MESETNDLKVIGVILEAKAEILNNPFSILPRESLEEALDAIETHMKDECE